MSVIYKDSFDDTEDRCKGNTEAAQWEREVNDWQRSILSGQKCSVCGEVVFRKKPFIRWVASEEIILCGECAEHTINGLSRDLAELNGDRLAIGKTGSIYGPIQLMREIDRLQKRTQDYLKRIIEMQELLARAK